MLTSERKKERRVPNKASACLWAITSHTIPSTQLSIFGLFLKDEVGRWREAEKRTSRIINRNIPLDRA